MLFAFIICFGDTFSQEPFIEKASELGIEHVQTSYDVIGGGVAIFDYNNDGFDDIYLTGGFDGDKLYQNNGDLSFTPVNSNLGLDVTKNFYTLAAVTADFDNDGFRDLFVTTGKNQECLIFKNQDANIFFNVTAISGITDKSHITGVTVLDVNQDGLLDIYIVGFIEEPIFIYDNDENIIGFDHDCYENKIYINQGNFVFEEMTDSLGVADSGCALAVAAFDANNDRVQDIYIANDFGSWVEPNSLLIFNTEQGVFEDRSAQYNLDDGFYGMGIAHGDLNNDGLFDLYATNIGRNYLYKNEGSEFSELAIEAGVANEFVGDSLSTSWGTVFFDYDNDGLRDLFVANGYIPAADIIPTSKIDPNKLYKNKGAFVFESIPDKENIEDEGISHGAASGDLDNNGFLDLVVTKLSNSDQEEINTLVLMNQLTEGNWIKIKCEGTETNRDAYGAVVKLYVSDTLILTEEILSSSSSASQNSHIAHFGIATHTSIDSLVVEWPSGIDNRFGNLPINQTIGILEGENEFNILGCMEENNEYFNPDATVNCCCSPNVVSHTEEISATPLDVYYNPLNNRLQLIGPEPTALFEVNIYDISGRIVVKHPNTNNKEFILPEMKSGIYVYQILNQNNQVAKVGKIVVSKF